MAMTTDKQQVDALLALIHSPPAPREAAKASLAERRAASDAQGAAGKMPQGCAHETLTAGGVACERVTPAEAVAGRQILYLHGGAYISGSPRSHRPMIGWIAAAAKTAALAPDYRLAPENPFPAAVEDAVAVYRWLLDELGGEASKIIIAGDSAGGGLTVATALALKQQGLPMPAGLFVISLWADLTQSSDTYRLKADADWMITKAGLDENSRDYVGGGDPKNPLASPVFGELAGLPPLLIQVGSEEALLGDSLMLAERAGLAQVAVRLEIYPHMFHVWHAFSGRLAAARRAIAEAGAWMDARLAPIG
jgi:monoterpene epsilon-lactone hydrolase